MVTVSELQQQKVITDQALYAGKITQAQHDAFDANQDRLIASLRSQNPPQSSPSQPPANTSYGGSTPIPADPQSPEYSAQGNYVEVGTTITNEAGQTGVVGTPSQPVVNPGESYTYTPPPQPPEAPAPPPTLGEFLTNPIGSTEKLLTETIGPTMNLAGQAAANSGDTALQSGIAVIGTIANEGTQTKNALTGIGNTILQRPTQPQPLPYTPSSPTQQTASDVFQVGQAAAVAVAAPVLAPVAGLTVGGVVAGEAIGGAVNLGIQGVTGQLEMTPIGVTKGAVEGMAQGGAFSLIGGGAMAGLGLAGKGLAPLAGRMGLNTAMGAGAGTVTEAYQTGKVTGQGALEGAAFGAAFGVGGEVAGYAGGKLNAKYDLTGKAERNIPVPKYGNVDVPLESGAEVNYKGLYISKGAEAKPVIGKMSPVPEGVGIKEGYVPESNIESTITQDIMGKAGYSPESIQAVKDVRSIMGVTENVRPKNIDSSFPEETGTLSKQGVSTVKEFVLTNKNQVDMVYGSFATKPQLSKSFEYVKDGKSALRTPGDIDVQLNTDQAGAEKFTTNLVTELQAKGEPVRVSKEKSTLIEADVGDGKFAHAVDIHYKGEVNPDSLTPAQAGEKRWGYKLSKTPVKIENLPAMALNEQGLRKGSAIMEFTPEQGVGSKGYRAKDAPDFFQAQRTLIEQLPEARRSATEQPFNRAMDYYGVTTKDMAEAPKTPDFIYNPNAKSPSSGLSLVSMGFSASAPRQNRESTPLSPSKAVDRSTGISPSKGLSQSIGIISGGLSPMLYSDDYRSNESPMLPSPSGYNPSLSSPPPSPSLPGYTPSPSKPSPPSGPSPYSPGYNPENPYPSNYTPPSRSDNPFRMPMLGNGGFTSGFESPLLTRSSRKRKRIRYYPVADPIEVGSALLP